MLRRLERADVRALQDDVQADARSHDRRANSRPRFIELETSSLPIAPVRPRIAWRDLLFKAGPLIALIALIGYLSIASPKFGSHANFMNIGRQTAPLAMIAIGQTFVILTGGIDLSVAAIAAFASAVTAVLMTAPLHLFGMDFGYLPIPLCIAAGLLVGLIAGIINGLIISTFHIPDFIATLGTMQILRGVCAAHNGRSIGAGADLYAGNARSLFLVAGLSDLRRRSDQHFYCSYRGGDRRVCAEFSRPGPRRLRGRRQSRGSPRMRLSPGDPLPVIDPQDGGQEHAFVARHFHQLGGVADLNPCVVRLPVSSRNTPRPGRSGSMTLMRVTSLHACGGFSDARLDRSSAHRSTSSWSAGFVACGHRQGPLLICSCWRVAACVGRLPWSTSRRPATPPGRAAGQ